MDFRITLGKAPLGVCKSGGLLQAKANVQDFGDLVDVKSGQDNGIAAPD
jgi:hypothetical protein